MIMARERLAQLLGSVVPPTAASVQVEAKATDLTLDVDGVGRIGLPVSAEQAGELTELGRPARFGRGQETLIDSRIRDTWEIPADLVHAGWSGTSYLDALRGGLGLPPGYELAADLHSMLVYGPGQFFVAHQDSEKDDTVIGTMAVTLPSAHTPAASSSSSMAPSASRTGGSNSAITLVAFYADCRHEVCPVKSGYRITLTYLEARGSSWVDVMHE